MAKVRETAVRYLTTWIDYAWSRSEAQARARYAHSIGMTATDAGAVQMAAHYLRQGEGPSALAVLVERVSVEEAGARLAYEARRNWFAAHLSPL